MTDPLLATLRTGLDRGLYLENVRSLLAISKSLAEDAEKPLAAYVLASVFGDLDSMWSGRPLPARQHEAAEQALTPLIRRVIFDLQREADESELAQSLNRLLAEFIVLQRNGVIA